MSQAQTKSRDTMTMTEAEAEAAFAATDADQNAMVRVDAAAVDSDHAEVGEGTTIRRAFTMKNFLPATGYLDWIMKNVVGKGSGHHELVGRVYGMVYEAEKRTTRWKDKGEEKDIASIALSGDLQAQAKDGRTTTFDILFLPMAFATRIERALRNGAHQVEIDVDIGIEATGKVIPYEWTVTSYLSGRAERALRNMANSRSIGQPAASVARAQLTNQVTIDHTLPIDDEAEKAIAETEKVSAGGKRR